MNMNNEWNLFSLYYVLGKYLKNHAVEQRKKWWNIAENAFADDGDYEPEKKQTQTEGSLSLTCMSSLINHAA